jgi:hypothetical protein
MINMGRAWAEVVLGRDLWKLVSRFDSSLVEVTPLTTLPSPHSDRASFRLRFDSGQIMKARRFESAAEAEVAETISRVIDPSHFPRVLFRRRAAMLIQWVEGQPLTAVHVSPALLREIGMLHGRLHTITPPKSLMRSALKQLHWRTRLACQFDQLVVHGALSKKEKNEAIGVALRHEPENLNLGLVHNDLCSENLVLSPTGRVWVVDNETLSIDSYDYDLARTWYRWPMDRLQLEAYLDGYDRHRSSSDFKAHFVYWAMTALAGSALFRLQHKTRGAEFPVLLLKALLRRNSAGDDSLFQDKLAIERYDQPSFSLQNALL